MIGANFCLLKKSRHRRPSREKRWAAQRSVRHRSRDRKKVWPWSTWIGDRPKSWDRFRGAALVTFFRPSLSLKAVAMLNRA
jgi:hypothetical protein